MNYKKFFLLVLFIPFSLLFLSSRVMAVDGYEENDTRVNAKQITAGSHTSLDVQSNDDDWYWISVSSNHTITVEVDFGTGDIAIRLYELTTQVASNYSSNGHVSVSFYSVNADTFYIWIFTYTATVTYDLSITLTKGVLGGDIFEYNSDFSHAYNLVTEGIYYKANGYELNCSDDDWYFLSVNSGDTLIVTIHFDNDLGDLGLSLYNSGQALLDECDGGKDAEMCYYSVTSTANYYILVEPNFYFGSNDYDMNVTIESSTSIPARSITFYAPLSGAVWDKSSTHAITWTTNGLIGNVTITFFSYSLAVGGTIATNTENDWYFEWTVPSDITPAADYHITIQDVAYGWGKSSDAFTIGPLGSGDDDDDDDGSDDDSGSSKKPGIPGYSAFILLGFTFFTTIGLIYYYSRRKNQILN